MRIEFGDLRLGATARKNLLRVLDTHWATAGPLVAEFEEIWGRLFDYSHNVAMSSGTDAGINACAILYDFGAARGDEIIVPALSFVATTNAVLAAGFTPVFADIERHTLNINPDAIEERISPRTRAIKVVHTMGKPCDMDRVMAIAKANNLMVIEDACEAHGAKYRDTFIGHFGDVATFSFYAAHLICCGEGGMASTMSEEVAAILRSTYSHGRRDGELYFDFQRVGFNSKMNDMEAAIGLEGIEDFWGTFKKRKENLNYILEHTRDLEEFAWFNNEESHEVICPHAVSVTLKDPKLNYGKLYAYLEEKSIKCKRNFGSIPTQHDAFRFLGHAPGDFPEAEYVGDNGLHFGIHQYLTRDDCDYVIEILHGYFQSL